MGDRRVCRTPQPMVICPCSIPCSRLVFLWHLIDINSMRISSFSQTNLMHKNNVHNVNLSRAVHEAFHGGYLSKANLFLTWTTGEQRSGHHQKHWCNWRTYQPLIFRPGSSFSATSSPSEPNYVALMVQLWGSTSICHKANLPERHNHTSTYDD